MDRRTFLTITVAAPLVGPRADALTQAAPTRAISWTQWGGPNRNFQTEASGLKDTWPAGGPRVVWKRALGEGYSAPAVEGAMLYTMYGRPRQEVIIAASAETGRTVWEHVNPVDFLSDAPDMGNGPYSAPLVAGERLFTVGVTGRLQCSRRRAAGCCGRSSSGPSTRARE